MEEIKNTSSFVPSLYIKQVGEKSCNLSLKLTMAKRKVVVRFTGGCGHMSDSDAEGLYDLFVESFAGFEGAIIFGGTRMIKRFPKGAVLPGITEIPPLIRKKFPSTIILGVVPKTAELRMGECGLIVSEESGKDFITITHPDQDHCLVVQESVDNGVGWEAEFRECISITNDLLTFAGFDSLLISYNGGGVTEKEILATAERGWPILLIADSGRKTEEYAKNEEFLRRYPNVRVAKKSVESIRGHLMSLGVIAPVFRVIEGKKTA
jgi:hypothetical protein